ncbi:MAG TPA: hypothetical protein VKB86_21410 [Pyrinomonadaceae bacterium]|nr:hypothetical protein [Pyrinomonadaceae bacterium]
MKIKHFLLTVLFWAISFAGFARSETTSKVLSAEEPASARSSHQTDPADQLATEVADAFKAKDLGKLDADHPYLRAVRIRLEHSITARIEIRSFKTLAQVEHWFRRGGLDPNRSSGAIKQCRRGVCTFDMEGMLHNTLYLQKITYGITKGRPYIKAIHIIDGD